MISPLGGALDWDGYAHTLDSAGVTTAQSTASVGWTLTPGNKTGTPSTTGGITNYAASTWTDNNTAGSGTATAWVGHAFQRTTLAASNSSVTTTDAATVYIPNAPLAGSNQTLTNPWALWVDAGNVRFDDNIHWLSGTSFKGIFDHANAADRTYTFPDATGNVPVLASQAEVNAMTSTTTALSPNVAKIVLATMQASTSGTERDFTGIPAGVRRITVFYDGTSMNNTAEWIIQIGDSGGFEPTGYLGSAIAAVAGGASAGTTPTSGFGVLNVNSSAVAHGSVILTLVDSATNLWSSMVSVGLSNAGVSASGGGSKALSATLDRVRLTTVAGTATFDAGNVSIAYER